MLKVNGIEKKFPDGQLPETLEKLLEQMGVKAMTGIALVDGKIVKAQQFAQTPLQKNQTIELIRFVPGG